MAISDLDPIIIDDDTSVPDVKNLTSKSIEGTGVFDNLMQVVKLHLKEEFDEGRITGQMYSDVYVGALGSVLQQSVAYLLNHETAKKIKADIGLVRQKTVTELTNTDNAIPTGLGFNDSAEVQGLVANQLNITAKEEDLLDSKILASDAEKALIGQRIISELATTGDSLVTAKAAGYGYNVADTVEGAMTAVADKAQSEADLMEQKLVTELGQTSDTKPNDLGKTVGTTIEGLVKAQTDLTTAQVAKVAEEEVLLAQKAISELAQTSDTVPTDTDALNTSSTVTGSLGKQKELYTAQTDGFARDAEQKLLKLMTDVLIVGISGDRLLTSDAKFTDPEIGEVVTKARQGIGLT